MLVRRLLAVTVASAACVGTLAVPSYAEPDLGVSAARNATDRFHSVDAAEAAGYGAFHDKDGVYCIDKPGSGTMGIHYVSAGVTDDQVNLTRPEAVIYAPQADGSLALVAVEYIVFQDAWDAHHNKPPKLFGREFEAVGADNRYGIPPFYELHAWIWRDNPNGMFEDWNPTFTC